eukprot:CAMPEP_0172429806 /NCGR_PEP_ID=MMETSP1064-20121228/51908_1 /TAXON_ID=202472 /ORGANISM="Aulacoseira subarctica , Strain CCAP 1002/5" /LENGTH=133 /DNA_ID=CAMNT_0013175467 /DNA_START=68 /DNA_END=469 /DNA_ORIENTATION=-
MTCGVYARNTLQSGYNLSMHYSGNFWAASCDYIADLPVKEAWPVRDAPWYFNYISAELWIGNYTGRNVTLAAAELWKGNHHNQREQDDRKFVNFLTTKMISTIRERSLKSILGLLIGFDKDSMINAVHYLLSF